jgi:ssDNA-binding Zn-finger/Zn-ribbon topoisomerase 1
MDITVFFYHYHIGEKCPACNGDHGGKGGVMIKPAGWKTKRLRCSRFPDCQFTGRAYKKEDDNKRKKQNNPHD